MGRIFRSLRASAAAVVLALAPRTTAVRAEQARVHPVPGPHQGGALPARRRPGAACRHPGDAPHLELPHPSRLHRAVAARLPDAVHEHALREQRGRGRFREAAARREGRASSSCASSPASPRCVLFAHSGGGPLMSLYQAVAEKGTVLLQGREQAHRMRRRSRRPAARRRHRVRRRASRQLDQHAARAQSVGRQREQPARRAADRRARSVQSRRTASIPNGPSNYSPEFQARYFKAQADRMNRLIDIAQRQARAHEAQRLSLSRRRHHRHPARRQSGLGTGRVGGAVHRAARASRRSTARRGRQRLLRNDGTIATRSRSRASTSPIRSSSRDNLRFSTGTKVYTLRSFLSANAIRAKNSIDDIDYCSTNNSTVCAVQSITVPVLFAAMGAHYFIRDNERHFDLADSKDKDFITIEGAVHGFTPCTRLREDAGAVFQLGQEPVRLHGEVDQRPLLIDAQAKGDCT